MMIGQNPKEVFLALNQEEYADAYLIKFVDLNISDQIEWYNSIGFYYPDWNHKYITAITNHEIKTNQIFVAVLWS